MKRELWEEAGVKVWDIKYHSTQPWVSKRPPFRWTARFTCSPLHLCVQPFPASLMIGFCATASESQELRVDLDNELAGEWGEPSPSHCTLLLIVLPSDARWFTREEILSALNHPRGTSFNPTNASEQGEHDPPFRLPPRAGIAGVMISDWAHGRPLDVRDASPRL